MAQFITAAEAVQKIEMELPWLPAVLSAGLSPKPY